MSRVLFLLLAMVLAGLGQPTLAAPLPDELAGSLARRAAGRAVAHGQRATAATGGRRAGPAG